nr:hypothetical protein [uncultured Brevundimonas sp.]
MVDLREPLAFTGRLARGELGQDVAFRLSLTPSGALIFDFDPLPFDRDTAWLRDRDDGDAVTYFTLVASAGEIRFTTGHLHLNAKVHVHQDGSSLDLKGQAQLAMLSVARTDEQPYLRMGVRGLQGFGRHTVETPLGDVLIGGDPNRTDDDRISGFIILVASSPIADLPAWREEAGRLLEYLRRMMSFASGRNLKGPTLEYATGVEWTLEILGQADGGDTHQPVIHFLDQKDFVRAAVDAWFKPAFKVEQLMFALEWYVMAAGYTEMRLVQAMTVLENLSHANLTTLQSQFLSPQRFRRLARDLRAAAPPADEDPALEAFLEALPGKLADLNRRPLKDKVRLLMTKWAVPVGDLDLGALDRAVNVRNEIVHRGHYRADEPRTADDAGLWPHVHFVREIIARIVFAMIAYKGARIGWIGGYHLTRFPPGEP